LVFKRFAHTFTATVNGGSDTNFGHLSNQAVARWIGFHLVCTHVFSLSLLMVPVPYWIKNFR